MRILAWTIAICAGCVPAPCGEVIVGGGSVELTLAPSGGEPWSLTFPGAAEPSYGGWGTKLVRDFSERVLDTLTFRHTVTAEDEPPCGLSNAAIRGTATWSRGEGEVNTLDTGHVSIDGDLVSGWASINAEQLTQPSSAEGSVTVEMTPYLAHPLCPPSWMNVLALSLSWTFDPATATDTVHLCR